GYEHNLGKIVLGDRVAKADTFPMGIDFQKYYKAESNPEVRKEISKRRKQLSNLKVVLSVDRLDYTKGILNRLQGYEIFLEKNPQWRKKVMLVLVVVPSRIGVEQYQQMKRQVDELVGKINGRWGTIGWTPISYQYRYLSFAPLVALYRVSDVSLVTPLRDGMNLVAKEYVATQTDKSSVLILSEMAGASKELGEAIIINPNNREEIAEAIKVALEMPLEEQKRRNLIMQERLMRYDVIRWANEFINELLLLKEEQVQFEARLLDSKGQEQLIKDFNNAQRRLIFLDYDGTLVPFADDPKKAKPTDELLEILERLSCLPSTEIVLISGRPKDNLQSWFGTLNICLVAEHGVWIKEKAADWKLAKPLTADWKAQLLPILNMYVDRLPQSFVEEKEFSIAFHYRRADPELASIRAKELIDDLVHFTANIDVQIFPGNKVVEIRNSGISKGTAGLYWIAKDEFDFIMAVGDDWTDEDLFKVLPKTAYSIRVGMASSHAKWNLHNPLETVQLLEQLVKK
ncbi:MAG: trehalose-phosphatase, partial [Planctomycetes bacterium RBG_16_43_13]